MLKEDHCYIQFGRCSCFSHPMTRHHYSYKSKDAYKSLYSDVSLQYLTASSCSFTCRHIFPSNESRQDSKSHNIKHSEPSRSFNYWLPFTLNRPHYIYIFPFLNSVTLSAIPNTVLSTFFLSSTPPNLNLGLEALISGEKVAPRSDNTVSPGFLVVAMIAEESVLCATPFCGRRTVPDRHLRQWKGVQCCMRRERKEHRFSVDAVADFVEIQAFSQVKVLLDIHFRLFLLYPYPSRLTSKPCSACILLPSLGAR